MPDQRQERTSDTSVVKVGTGQTTYPSSNDVYVVSGSAETVLVPRSVRRSEITSSQQPDTASTSSGTASVLAELSKEDPLEGLSTRPTRRKRRSFSADELAFVKGLSDSVKEFNVPKTFEISVPLQKWNLVWDLSLRNHLKEPDMLI
jgi:hypothetical protein